MTGEPSWPVYAPGYVSCQKCVAKGQSDVAPYKVVNLAQAVTAKRKLVRLCSHAVLAAIETLGKHATSCSILLTNTSKANFRG